jgi:hypothetical protein
MAPPDTECYGIGSGSKPAWRVPECKERHAKSLHDMMAGMTSAVNAVDFDEDDEEEGYVNTLRGGYWMVGFKS